MAAYIKQGVTESLVLEMPFATNLLSSFTMDIFQHGELVVTKTDADCFVSDLSYVVTCPLSQEDTLKLSPQRAALNFRGLNVSDGSTVIIEDIPVIVDRSNYRTKAVPTE